MGNYPLALAHCDSNCSHLAINFPLALAESFFFHCYSHTDQDQATPNNFKVDNHRTLSTFNSTSNQPKDFHFPLRKSSLFTNFCAPNHSSEYNRCTGPSATVTNHIENRPASPTADHINPDFHQRLKQNLTLYRKWIIS